MSDIKEILIELGYQLTPDKDGWRTNAVFRGGDNPTAIKVYSNGFWQDFVENHRGNLNDLIKLTLGLDDVKTIEWIKNKNIVIENNYKPKIKIPEIFDENILKDLIPDYNYWINRGIPEETCLEFKGGLCLDSQGVLGKLKRRQILTIYNNKNQIVGFTGRAIDKDAKIKYRHLGSTSLWVWPAYINHKFIQESKEVFLVESPVCCMKLHSIGIKNSLSLFGTECSYAILNYLLKINPKRIFISTNNEESGVGNRAAEKVYSRLKRYFNSSQLKIYLPPAKDFGEIKDNNIILDWYNNRNN